MGRSKDLKPEVKAEIFDLLRAGNLKSTEIGKKCGVKSTTVRSLKNKIKNGKTQIRSGRCYSGRGKKTTEGDDALIINWAKDHPKITSEEISKQLEFSGVKIASSTVRRRLLGAGISRMEYKIGKNFKKDNMWKLLREKVDAFSPRSKETWVQAIRDVLDNDPDMEYKASKKKNRRTASSVKIVKEDFPNMEFISPHPEINTLSFSNCNSP